MRARARLESSKIHAGLEKLHGEGVPEDVGRYGLCGQVRPNGHCLGGRSSYDVGRPEAREALIVGADKDRSWFVVGDSAFAQQAASALARS